MSVARQPQYPLFIAGFLFFQELRTSLCKPDARDAGRRPTQRGGPVDVRVRQIINRLALSVSRSGHLIPVARDSLKSPHSPPRISCRSPRQTCQASKHPSPSLMYDVATSTTARPSEPVAAGEERSCNMLNTGVGCLRPPRAIWAAHVYLPDVSYHKRTSSSRQRP
ncbi:hypothetical protein Bbelb_174520 [Branchiostoma belcheri]|nr:hypothetical protein Bbelb_174520 [Branchiostoma belcheri]